MIAAITLYVVCVLAIYAANWLVEEDRKATLHRAVTKCEFPPGPEGSRLRRFVFLALAGGALLAFVLLRKRRR